MFYCLGTMIPKSGGDYAYILDAFGPLPSFLYLWSALLVIMPTGSCLLRKSEKYKPNCLGNAITALTFANYVLEPFYPECSPPSDAVRIIAAMLICRLTQTKAGKLNVFTGLLTAVNCQNVKMAAKVQEVFSITKV